MTSKYRRNPFRDDPVYAALEALARQQSPASSELGAIEVSAIALLFIFAPPASFRDEEGRVVASKEEMLIDMERGHAYVAALAPWVDEVKKRATKEQRQFLQKIGLDGTQDEEDVLGCSVADEAAEEGALPGDDLEHRPHAKILPEPAHAASILEALSRQYDPGTADNTCLELAANTLRYLVKTHQVDAFCAYLDKAGRLHTPTGARPDAG
jgi:hypothetical protein